MTFVKNPGDDPTQTDDHGLGNAGIAAGDSRIDRGGGENAIHGAAAVGATSDRSITTAGELVTTAVAEKAREALGDKLPGVAGGGLGRIAGGEAAGSLGAEGLSARGRGITSSAGGFGQSSTLRQAEGVVGMAVRGIQGLLGGKNLEIAVDSGDELDVREFSVRERLSSLFEVNLVVMSHDPSVDFDAVVGRPARFVLRAGAHERSWSGLCNHLEQVRVEPSGLSTYQISIVPTLWLLTQRKNYRMFQQISEPDIAIKLLNEWNIEPEVRIDRGAYKKRKYRVQYGESDFAFISRMLEDAGITYHFEQVGDETKLVLSDAPHATPARALPLTFLDDVSLIRKSGVEFVTGVRVRQRVRPGRYTLRDHDYRRPPSYKLMSTASSGRGAEDRLERYQYTPGAFLFGTEQGDATPMADDRGKTRTDEREAAILVQKRLDAKRGSARVCAFETNAHDLAPGVVMRMTGHPHEALGEDRTLLIVESTLSGTSAGEWSHRCEARGTNIPFRPELATPKPRVNGVESATVVGPPNEEIHTDEFGRVRVHFHWDRESQLDEKSSCWIHVSQPWGGAGYGGVSLPRIGQEVLVDFLGGDPDRPVIVGRVYTNLQKVPYTLPANKTRSGWRSNSTGGGGGYNELMFDDTKGRELFNIQAEHDLSELVKHDAKHTVKHDRSTTVWNNDSQLVGSQHSLTIASAVTAGGPQPGPTKVTMVHERIELTTGKASIILEGPNITFRADQDISATALKNIALVSTSSDVSVTACVGGVAMMGMSGIGVSSPNVVQIDGAVGVHINCTSPPATAELPQPSLGEVAMNALTGGLMGAGLAVITAAAPVVGVVMGVATMAGAAYDGLTGG